MARIKKKTIIPELVQNKIYSARELNEFDMFLRSRFFIEKSFLWTGLGTASVFDTEMYLKSVGALTSSGCNWFVYEKEMDKIEQWIRWHGRREYAKKKNLEELSIGNINKI